MHVNAPHRIGADGLAALGLIPAIAAKVKERNVRPGPDGMSHAGPNRR